MDALPPIDPAVLDALPVVVFPPGVANAIVCLVCAMAVLVLYWALTAAPEG